MLVVSTVAPTMPPLSGRLAWHSQGGQAPDSRSLEAEPALPPPLTQLCTARSARWDSGDFWALDTKQ